MKYRGADLGVRANSLRNRTPSLELSGSRQDAYPAGSALLLCTVAPSGAARFPFSSIELAIGWREDDGVDEPSQRLSGFRAGLLTFQGVTGTGNQSSELTRSRRRALVGGCSSLYNAAT